MVADDNGCRQGKTMYTSPVYGKTAHFGKEFVLQHSKQTDTRADGHF